MRDCVKFRGKEHYDKPETAMTRLELESPICGGSTDFVNNEENFGINSQKTATGFDVGNQTTGGNNVNGWDYSGTSGASDF